MKKTKPKLDLAFSFLRLMRIRVYVGNRILGPGKMELLWHIDATGSLAAPAKKGSNIQRTRGGVRCAVYCLNPA